MAHEQAGMHHGADGDDPRGEDHDEKTLHRSVGVADYIFRAPTPPRTALLLLLLGAVAGVALYGPAPSSLVGGVVAFSLPLLLGAPLTWMAARSLGGSTYLRRTMLISVAGLIFVIPMLLVGGALRLLRPVDAMALHLFVIGVLVYWFHLTLVTTSHHGHLRTIPATVISPVLLVVVPHLAAPLLGAPLVPLRGGDAGLALALGLIFLLCAMAFSEIPNAPMRRVFGINGLALVRYMLAHWTEGEAEGVMEMEHFFDSFSRDSHAHADVVALRAQGCAVRQGETPFDVLWVLPSVHPGPFGHLGGSNLPTKLARLLAPASQTVLVPHSASHHDLNPPTTPEVDRLGGAILRGLAQAPAPSGEIGPFVRPRGPLPVGAQSLGALTQVFYTESPAPADDVDPTILQPIEQQLAHEGVTPRLGFVDCHNCVEHGTPMTHRGDPKAAPIAASAEAAARAAAARERRPFSFGAAVDERLGSAEGLGPAGVRVLVLRTPGQTMAYVLIDGNNVLAGIRDRVRGTVLAAKLVDELEVLTTDNHVTNVTIGGFNAVGLKVDEERLTSVITQAIETALERLTPGEVTTIRVETPMRLFGYGSTSRLSATINACVAVMRVGLVVTLGLAIGGSLAVVGWGPF